MQIIEAVERTPIVIPIADVMDVNGAFTFIPDVLKKGYFDIDYRRNELVLVAGKYIGQIPLTIEIGIHVKPKVTLSNLARLISVANQPVRCLQFFQRKYALSLETSNSFQEGFARSLLFSLRELDEEGVYREYQRRSETFSAPRGRVQFNEYIRNALSRAKTTTVSCTHYVFTADTTLNRVIKLALWVLGKTLSVQKDADPKVIQGLEYFYDLFQSVRLETSRSLIRRAESDRQRNRLPELRSYYSDIVDVCLVVLNQHSLDIASQSGKLKTHSFILSLEDTFERYIREVLRGAEELKSMGVSVGDGNTDSRRNLFSDSDMYDAKPDFVLSTDTSCKAIGDTKYKTRLAENDRYQLISHALSFGAQNAFFVTPAQSSADAGPTRMGLVGTSNPILIQQYRFDLDNTNLPEEECRFIDWVITQL